MHMDMAIYQGLRHGFAALLSNLCCVATLSPPGHRDSPPGTPRRKPGGLRTEGDPMPEALTDGVIRKLWIDRAGPYRDHLLRLDADSRRSRFGGAVSDAFITNYIELSLGLDAVIHGFFVDGVLRGVAELRPLGGEPAGGGRSGVLDREAVAEPRGRHRAAGAHAARGAQSRHQAPAHGVPRQQPAHDRSRAQVRGRAEVRFRQRGRRGRGAASDPDVGAARIRRRHVTALPPPCSTCRRRCCGLRRTKFPLMPANAGIQSRVLRSSCVQNWIPAFAGMSGERVDHPGAWHTASMLCPSGSSTNAP